MAPCRAPRRRRPTLTPRAAEFYTFGSGSVALPSTFRDSRMKTERRHELQQNELAQWLSTYVPSHRQYLTALGGLLIFAGVLWGSMSLLRVYRQRNLASSWSEFTRALQAGDIQDLRDVAERYRQYPAAARALQAAGILNLENGVRSLLTDRGEAMESLKLAREDFQSALNLGRSDPFLRPQLLLGLAQAHEAMNQLDQAKEQYSLLADAKDGAAYTQIARYRLKFLGMPDTQEFSTWYAKQKAELPANPVLGGATPSPPTVYDDLKASDLLLPDKDALQRGELEKSFGPLQPPESGTSPPSDE